MTWTAGFFGGFFYFTDSFLFADVFKCMGETAIMKRVLMFFLLVLLLVTGVSGCGSSKNDTAKKSEAPGTGVPKLKIVTTIFPEYSWTKELLGSQEKDTELTLLTKKGADMHSYQPSAEDILHIANCDLFIYVGGESDKWVGKALQEGGNPKRKVISLMKLMGNRAKVEEEVEGMEKHEHEKEHDKDKHDGQEHHEQPEYDEHVWLSLKNADIICKAIAEELAASDQKNAAVYEAHRKCSGVSSGKPQCGHAKAGGQADTFSCGEYAKEFIYYPAKGFQCFSFLSGRENKTADRQSCRLAG